MTPVTAAETDLGVDMWTAMFWKQVAERAVKTFAQALLALWTANKVANVLEVDWKTALGVAALSVLYSVLTSLISAPLGPDKDSPSLVDTPPPGPDSAVDNPRYDAQP